jgi:hypothetical protein
VSGRTILPSAPACGDVAAGTTHVCETCEQRNDVIVELEHLIRELRHDLVIAQIEAELSKGNELFALWTAA